MVQQPVRPREAQRVRGNQPGDELVQVVCGHPLHRIGVLGPDEPFPVEPGLTQGEMPIAAVHTEIPVDHRCGVVLFVVQHVRRTEVDVHQVRVPVDFGRRREDPTNVLGNPASTRTMSRDQLAPPGNVTGRPVQRRRNLGAVHQRVREPFVDLAQGIDPCVVQPASRRGRQPLLDQVNPVVEVDDPLLSRNRQATLAQLVQNLGGTFGIRHRAHEPRDHRRIPVRPPDEDRPAQAAVLGSPDHVELTIDPSVDRRNHRVIVVHLYQPVPSVVALTGDRAGVATPEAGHRSGSHGPSPQDGNAGTTRRERHGGPAGRAERWRWDLNPRRVAPHTLSSPATCDDTPFMAVRPRLFQWLVTALELPRTTSTATAFATAPVRPVLRVVLSSVGQA